VAEPSENVASLMARKDYASAVPMLRKDLEKYPSNVRIRLQLADALAGQGNSDEALDQYEETARYYDENGLTIQAIAVRKKAEKLQQKMDTQAETPPAAPAAPAPPAPVKQPRSPLFEDMSTEERDSLVREMVLEEFGEGDIIITEGEEGSSLYVIVSGEVKVYTKGSKGENLFLARLEEGDFFGEVGVLTGKPRTATITASQQSELLRLDKDKLDAAVVSHPRIREILDQFYRRRADQTVEAMIENLKKKKET
jgi:tetratricopeptide (TPR) repeat protein